LFVSDQYTGLCVQLLAWLKGFSNQITERTQAVNSRIDALTQDTRVAQSELHNAFTSLQQLSNTQFIEQVNAPAANLPCSRLFSSFAAPQFLWF
jgi:hypothetical protein